MGGGTSTYLYHFVLFLFQDFTVFAETSGYLYNRQMLMDRGNKGWGAKCMGSEECRRGLFCRPDGDPDNWWKCQHQRMAKNPGDNCMGSDEYRRGLVCRADGNPDNWWKCQYPVNRNTGPGFEFALPQWISRGNKEGDLCGVGWPVAQNHGDCEAGLICVPVDDGSICMRRALPGQPCRNDKQCWRGNHFRPVSLPVKCNYDGVCQIGFTRCQCPFKYQPVCGTNGREYNNPCLARCQGVRVKCHGTCPCGGCPCPFNYDPVCGTDGRQYGNQCAANCQGVTVACYGECPCRGDGGCRTDADCAQMLCHDCYLCKFGRCVSKGMSFWK